MESFRESFNSKYSTLSLMVIKEIRMERNIPIAAWAQTLGKTPSALVKIENGQSGFSIEALFSAGQTIGIFPSVIINITERLISIFNKNNFYFSFTLENDEDQLLKLVQQYYNSTGYKNLKLNPSQMVSILNVNNPFLSFDDPTIVRYCCDPNFKKWVDDGATGMMPSNKLGFPPNLT